MREGASHLSASGDFLLFLSKSKLLGVPQDPKSITENNRRNLQGWLQDVHSTEALAHELAHFDFRRLGRRRDSSGEGPRRDTSTKNVQESFQESKRKPLLPKTENPLHLEPQRAKLPRAQIARDTP